MVPREHGHVGVLELLLRAARVVERRPAPQLLLIAATATIVGVSWWLLQAPGVLDDPGPARTAAIMGIVIGWPTVSAVHRATAMALSRRRHYGDRERHIAWLARGLQLGIAAGLTSLVSLATISIAVPLDRAIVTAPFPVRHLVYLVTWTLVRSLLFGTSTARIAVDGCPALEAIGRGVRTVGQSWALAASRIVVAVLVVGVFTLTSLASASPLGLGIFVLIVLFVPVEQSFDAALELAWLESRVTLEPDAVARTFD